MWYNCFTMGQKVEGEKSKVVVLMGGKTPEHEISLISGTEVAKNLSPEKYKVLSIKIPRQGIKWQTIKKIIQQADAVFIAMHGPFGEDGTVQGMLELIGVPYTGSGVLASAIGMDKIIFRKLVKPAGIPIPKFVEIAKSESVTKVSRSLGTPPYFVKPHNQGSSVGASVVRSKNELTLALKKAWQYSDIALVEEFLRGKEVTCGLLGNEDPQPLPVVEIIPSGEFFDYKSKYKDKNTREIVPARISKTLTKKLQDLAVKVHKTVGCRGFSRVDFILKDGKKPIVLEINTIPGLTSMSLLPKAAAAAGISYPQLLDKIIEYSLE